MKNKFSKVFYFCSLFFGVSIAANAVTVDCGSASLQAAVDAAVPGDTIQVTGVCHEALTIKTNDLTLVGDSSGSKAIISGENLFFPTLLKVDGAVRIKVAGFIITQGLFGVHGLANASFSLTDTEISKNIIGVQLESNTSLETNNVDISTSDAIGLNATAGSTVAVLKHFSITGAQAFGLNVIGGSTLKVHENATMQLTQNFFGGQISVNSSLFVDENAKVNADNNILIGLSINTGSSVIVFNGDISANNNGLDGLDVISSANLDLDGDSTLIVNNNGREDISIDDGNINIFGFFSSQPGLPKIVTNENTNNGIQIEFGGKLDIGRNSSLEVMNNGKAGISLDDGSSANVHDSEILGNNGILVVKGNDEDYGSKKVADIILTFASRASFRDNNNIGLVLCDKSSRVRGDVKCKH